jgi:hypothetical protein
VTNKISGVLIISFDIDNTLIPYSNEFATYKLNPINKLIGAEALRLETKELFQSLIAQNHTIWIYTTSYRSVFHLRKTFWAHGLKPKRFINEHINQKTLRKHKCKASKNPALYGIDLHIDDAEGVAIEGEKYGFNTLIINPTDGDWMEKIKAKLSEI